MLYVQRITAEENNNWVILRIPLLHSKLIAADAWLV